MADIIRLRSDQHRQTQSLLPWYVSGALEPEEAEAVAAHLSECAECRAELEAEKTMAEQMASLPDRGWAAIVSRLENAPQPMRRWPDALFSRRVPIGWALAAAAAGLVLAIGLGAPWAPRSPQPSRPLYRTLSAEPSLAPGNVVVVFLPTTSEAELRGALRKSGARLVGGPTVSDAYVLHVDAAKRTDALAALRSDRHVVLAEPIDGYAQP
jgi:anti-sigma factor RsiW